MIHIEAEGHSVHQSLVDEGVTVTHDAVMAVFSLLLSDYPETLDPNAFGSLREKLVAAMREEAPRFGARSDLFPTMVVSGMIDSGDIKKPQLPNDLQIPSSALNKLTALVGNKRPRQNEIVAYIILNCSSTKEVVRIIRAADFTADETQVLLPVLWAVCKQDEGVKTRLVARISSQESMKGIANAARIVEEYCFNLGSQPYGLVGINHPEIPEELLKPLFENVIVAVLQLLKEYLLS